MADEKLLSLYMLKEITHASYSSGRTSPLAIP